MKKLMIMILFLNINFLFTQIPDCMCPPLSFPLTGELINIDTSIVIDTCGIWYPSTNCDHAYWNNINSEYSQESKDRVYARSYWVIYFEVDAIPLQAVPYDSMLYVSLNAIDSINYPEIKAGFNKLENDFGSFIFRKQYPDRDSGYSSRKFILTFDNYVNVTDVSWFLWNIPSTPNEFQGWPTLSGSNPVKEVYSSSTDFFIYSNFKNKSLEINSTSNQSIKSFMIFSIQGNILFEKHFNNYNKLEKSVIDISELSVGFYFIRINELTYKFINLD